MRQCTWALYSLAVFLFSKWNYTILRYFHPKHILSELTYTSADSKMLFLVVLNVDARAFHEHEPILYCLLSMISCILCLCTTCLTNLTHIQGVLPYVLRSLFNLCLTGSVVCYSGLSKPAQLRSRTLVSRCGAASLLTSRSSKRWSRTAPADSYTLLLVRFDCMYYDDACVCSVYCKIWLHPEMGESWEIDSARSRQQMKFLVSVRHFHPRYGWKSGEW